MFENQPVVSLHQVDPLWHLNLATPDNVAKCELVKSGLKREIMHCAMILKPLKRGELGADTTHNDGINLLLRKAARARVNSCWLTSLTETDGIFSERISVIMRARVVRC